MENTSDQHEASDLNSNNNTNNNNSKMGHSSVAAATHPLQEIELHADEVDEAMPKNKSKGNWVKFDDEVNGISENKNENFGGGSDRSGSKTISDAENATRSATTTTTTTTTTATGATENRLSPLPAPPSKLKTSVNTTTSIARPRTPSESSQQQQQQHQAKTAAPVQGFAVSSSSHMPDVTPAVLDTESTHVNLNAFGKSQQHPQQQQLQKPKATNVPATSSSLQHTTAQSTHHSNNGTSSSAIHKTTNIAIPVESVPTMRTIELSTGRIREGFANGDVIVTLLPANTKWPWITPAIFRPELVPEELMAQGLTLTVEEYVHAMETLVTDYRFTVYNICYKRILVCWILFAFAVLLTLLFSGLQGVALFALGVGWLFLNAAAIFLCMWVKLRLSRGLEKCLARVNKQLMKHKILLILDDRGRISCHKVNLCFLYFDATQCVNFLNEFLEQTEQNGGEAIKAGWEAKLDIDMNDIIIQGSNPVRLSRKQAVAQELFLSYLQRWGKDFLRRRLDWIVQEAGVHETPRHLQSSLCPCQYEEEVLRNKIKTHLKRNQCCGVNCLACWM